MPLVSYIRNSFRFCYYAFPLPQPSCPSSAQLPFFNPVALPQPSCPSSAQLPFLSPVALPQPSCPSSAQLPFLSPVALPQPSCPSSAQLPFLSPVVKILKKAWAPLENLGESGAETFKRSDREKFQF